MEAYLIKSNIALAVFYLLYRLIIYSGGDHQVKRFVGIGVLLFSCLFLLIPSIQFTSPNEPNQFEELLQNTSRTINTYSGDTSEEEMSLFMILYLVGVCFFFSKFLIGVIGLIKLYIRSEKSRKWGFELVETNKPISPFSFFHLLFLRRGETEKVQLKPIVIHEKLHKDQLHSIDVILLEISSILFWFNPFIWLLKKDIKASHEFIADRHVIDQGCDKLEYQELLFKARTGVSFRAATHLSNQTSLKQRFNMMETTKRQDGTVARVSLMVLVMVVIGSISSFSFNTEGFRNELISVQIFTKNGLLDIEKGISRTSETLFVRINAELDENIVGYRITETETTLISNGKGRWSVKTGEMIQLGDRLLPAVDGVLRVDVLEYQTKDKDGNIASVLLEEPIRFEFPVK